MYDRNRWSRRRPGPRVCALLIGALLMGSGAASCSSDDQDRPASPPLSAPAEQPEAAPTVDAVDAAALATHTRVAMVAGRIGDEKRRRIKKVIGGIVERYLEGGFTGGTYPREDFSAAFVDFRDGAADDAAKDGALLTNQDIGGRVSSVTATHRRLRIDLLAPDGRMSAATARFALDFDTTGEVAQSQRVAGSLFLTNQHGAWKVFGYDVHKGVQ